MGRAASRFIDFAKNPSGHGKKGSIQRWEFVEFSLRSSISVVLVSNITLDLRDYFKSSSNLLINVCHSSKPMSHAW